jgi:PAS domain S-box-containing protein
MKMNSELVLAALDEGDSAIAVLRPDTFGKPRIVEVNKTHIRLLGYARDEMIGMSLWAHESPHFLL